MDIIHFNWLHPKDFVHQEWNKTKRNNNDGFESYAEWLLENGYGMADVFASYLQEQGFSVANFYWSDSIFVEKFNTTIRIKYSDAWLIVKYLTHLGPKKIYSFFSLRSVKLLHLSRMKLIKHIVSQNAKVIFIREPAGLDHMLLQMIKKATSLKVIGLIGCEFKYIPNFNPHLYDSILVLTKENKLYFSSLQIKVRPFKYGWFYNKAKRVYKYDIIFIGDLYHQVQKKKAELMNDVANYYQFKWWGPCNVSSEIYPALHSAYEGVVAGNTMLDNYAASKIVLNDYPANAGGDAVNMRIWDVISAGSFLLTRNADNLSDLINNGGLSVFTTNDQCIGFIKKYLDNDDEREQQAKKLSGYCEQNYSINHGLDLLKKEIKTMSHKN